MRSVVVLLSIFAVALCAPTGEKADALEIDGDDMRVKRAKEVMMYGNQQNEQQSSVKRANPSDNVDENGYIVANEATDLETENDEENQEKEDITEETTQGNDEINESNIEDIETEQQESQETETTEQDREESTEEVPETSTALEPVTEDADENDDEMSVEEYLKELEKLQDEDSNENMAPYLDSLLKETSYPYWNQFAYRDYNTYNAPYSNYQRYRRSQVRNMNNMKNMQFPMLKRSHRVKRQAYYLPEVDGYLPYDERFLDTPYNNYPVTEEDLAELLDVLDDSKPYEDDVFMSPYEEYPPYEEANDIEFDSPIYMPKRQSGLSFVPGIKRNRDFFPSFKEPESHFQAFVPNKRSLREEAEAYDAYETVMALAAALRQPQNYYQGEYYEGYRRRK